MTTMNNRFNKIITSNPEFTNNTPLDIFFNDLNENFIEKINNFSIDEQNKNIYQFLKLQDNQHFVEKLLNYFEELHELLANLTTEENVIDSKGCKTENENNILPISLHDIKFLDQLLSMVIVHGIDANISPNLRIPLDSKRLNTFRNKDDKFIIPNDHKINSQTLKNVVDTFYKIIKHTNTENSDKKYLKLVILRGPIYANLYLALLNLQLLEPNSVQIKEKIIKLEAVQDTYSLFVMYTLLTQTVGNVLAKSMILERLSTLPIRRSQDGLTSLVDFILGVREDEQIDLDKIKRVSQIVLSKPKSIPNVKYLSELFSQIYDCLTYTNRPILVTCVNNIITDFYYKNKKIVKDFLFKKIYEILFNVPLKDRSIKELNDMINVLISLSKNTSTDLVIDLTAGLSDGSFYTAVWIYCLFLKKNQVLDPLVANNLKKEDNSPYYEVILSLLQTFIVVTDNYQILNVLTLSLLNLDHEEWCYKIDLETQLPYIVLKDNKEEIGDLLNKTDKLDEMSKLFQDIDLAVGLFIDLLKLINNDEKITDLFLLILERWINNTSNNDNNQLDNDELSKNLLIIIDLKILQKMNEDFKTEIIKNRKDVLRMVDKLLNNLHMKEETSEASREVDSDDEDDDEEENERADPQSTKPSSTAIQIMFDLLHLILNGLTNTPDYTTLLHDIKEKLKLYESQFKEVNELQKQINGILNDKIVTTSQEDTDYDVLNRALINISDTLVPIKAHGFSELRQLVEKKSKVISIDRVLNINLQNLKNSDPFIYLNVIKSLMSLIKTYPEETLDKLLDFYNNDKRKNKLDDILKVGEVIVKYIEQQNELFQGQYANEIIDICLSKIRQHDQLDNRIRMSAMSILGMCLQVNSLGVQSRVPEMLDCVFGILQLETTERETTKKSNAYSFVMRRSAMHLIHDLLLNSGLDLFPEQYNSARLKTLLEFVRTHDADYLVCEQAAKLLEIIPELEVSNWQEQQD